MRAMQGYEFAALYVLAGVTAFLVRDRIGELLSASLPVRLGALAVVAFGLGLPLLVRGNNLVRDRFEPLVVGGFVAICIGLVVWSRRDAKKP